MTHPVVIDFETEAIENRPKYPPTPVGVGIRWPGKKGKYYSWGHPTGNNCTFEEARRELAKVPSMVCHNLKFDGEVMADKMDLPVPEVCHDTMILAYLHNPHERSIGLKQVGPKILGTEATERDELRAWILENIKGATPKGWGAHISKAPGELVGRYCDGDLRLTHDLYKFLYPKVITESQMGAAYQRELDLIPVLLKNEQTGIRIDRDRLGYDIERYDAVLAQCTKWIQKALHADINVDSDIELANAIEKNFPSVQWVLTEKGQRSTSKENLPKAIGGVAPKLVAMMEYRSVLAKCLSTYMKPWFEAGEWLHTQWNSTSQPEGGGTRSGRLSSSHPNLQNIPTLETIEAAEAAIAALRLKWMVKLPRIRSYVLPDAPGHVLVGADLSQQEPRMLAYFENDVLEAQFREDPLSDVYVMMLTVLKSVTGIEITRKAMKTLVLAIIYGLGLGNLAQRLGCTVQEAQALRKALYAAFPGIKELQDELKVRAGRGEPMRTWGGRLYYAEEPRIIKGQVRSFGYKMVNYLCQGSSADYTKEAMLRYHHRLHKGGRLILTVHDELVISVPRDQMRAEAAILKDAMVNVPGMTFQMRVDVETGPNWGAMSPLEI